MAGNIVVTFECCICNETTVESNEALCATVSCGHVFHEKCLKTWQTTGHKTCPVCRITYTRTLAIFGNSLVANEEADDDDSNNDHYYEEEYNKILKKYTETLKNFNSEAVRCDQLERKVAALTMSEEQLKKSEKATKKKLKDLQKVEAETSQKLNEAMFKLSMYHELFGPECAIQFDQVIHNETIRDDNLGMGNLNLVDISDSDDDIEEVANNLGAVALV